MQEQVLLANIFLSFVKNIKQIFEKYHNDCSPVIFTNEIRKKKSIRILHACFLYVRLRDLSTEQ